MNRLLKNQILISSLFIILLTIIAYLPIFQAEFVEFDDRLYVTQNDHVRAGLTKESIYWAFTHFHSANWHPLTWLSHMLDCELYGMNPFGHHLTNLLLHITNCILLYLFFLYATKAQWCSLALALLFAIHPLHVESVAWIAERKDVLSTFWGLLCLMAYRKYAQTFQKRDYFWMFTCLCLSLMSKPMLVTLPILMVILDIWPLNRRDNNRYKDKLPLLIPVMGISMVTYIAQFQDKAVNSFSSICLEARILNALISYGKYLSKTIWPANLAVLYPHPGNTVPIFPAICYLILLTSLFFACLYAFKKMPFLFTGYLWFLIALLPVIGIIQVGSQSMADRYTYVPHIGLFWAIVWGFASFTRAKKPFWGKTILTIVLICFVLKTYDQTRYWQNATKLFNQAIANTQNNYLIHCNLGVCAYENFKPEEALIHFNNGLAIRPQFYTCRLNKAKCLLYLGRIDAAESEYQVVLEQSPENVGAQLGLAEIYKRRQQYQMALAHCQKALKASNEPEKIYAKIAQIFEKDQKYTQAAYYYHQAITINPLSAVNHYDYARMMVSLQKNHKAFSHFNQAIDLNPNFAEAYNSLGALYAWDNQLPKAYEYISIAYQLSPENQNILKNYRKICQKLGLKTSCLDNIMIID